MMTRIYGSCYVRSLLAYTFVVALAFRFSSPSAGLLYSGDNSFPTSVEAARRASMYFSSAWSSSTIFGSYPPEQGSWWVAVLRYCVYALTNSPALAQRLEYIGVAVLACLAMFSLLKYLGFASPIGWVMGLAYGLGPSTFNLTVMGWIYVLWALALAPLCIMGWHWSLQRRPSASVFLIGVLVGLTLFTSSLMPAIFILLFLLTVMTLAQRQYQHFQNLCSLVVLIIGVGISSAFWILPRLLYPQQVNEALGNSAASIGTSSRVSWLTPLNLSGTGFNDSFARQLPELLQPFTFTFAAVALIGVFAGWRRQIPKMYFAIAWLAFVLLALLDQTMVLSALAKVGVGRDSARLFTLAALVMIPLAANGLQAILRRWSIHSKPLIWASMIVATAFAAWPYIDPGIEPGTTPRSPESLAMHAISPDGLESWETAEKTLAADRSSGSFLALPNYPFITYTNDAFFDGEYHTAVSPLTDLPLPGSLPNSDKLSGNFFGQTSGDILNESLSSPDNLHALLRTLGANYVVVMTSAKSANPDESRLDSGAVPNALLDKRYFTRMQDPALGASAEFQVYKANIPNSFVRIWQAGQTLGPWTDSTPLASWKISDADWAFTTEVAPERVSPVEFQFAQRFDQNWQAKIYPVPTGTLCQSELELNQCLGQLTRNPPSLVISPDPIKNAKCAPTCETSNISMVFSLESDLEMEGEYLVVITHNPTDVQRRLFVYSILLIAALTLIFQLVSRFRSKKGSPSTRD